MMIYDVIDVSVLVIMRCFYDIAITVLVDVVGYKFAVASCYLHLCFDSFVTYVEIELLGQSFILAPAREESV